MNHLKQLLSTINLVVNPIKLVKLGYKVDHLIKTKRNPYPNDISTTEQFLKVDDEIYLFKRKKLIRVETLPNKANVIFISQRFVTQAMDIVGESGTMDFNCLIVKLKKIKEFEIYEKVFDCLAEDFSINISLKQLVKNISTK